MAIWAFQAPGHSNCLLNRTSHIWKEPKARLLCDSSLDRPRNINAMGDVLAEKAMLSKMNRKSTGVQAMPRMLVGSRHALSR